MKEGGFYEPNEKNKQGVDERIGFAVNEFSGFM